MRTCSIDNCENHIIAKTFCNKHYNRFRKHGSPYINLIKINPCIVEGCDVRRARQGYCSKHWGYFSRYGSATPGVKLKFHGKSFDESYEHWVIKKSENECWAWAGFINKGGYGYFSTFGEHKAAHRYSYEKHIGKIPEGMWVLHKCDNPPCSNPSHLFVGNNSDNVKDSYNKGRRKPVPTESMPRGSKCHLSKLKEHEVENIKKMIRDGVGNKEIAFLYKVTHKNISAIRVGKIWKHIQIGEENGEA